MAVIGIARNLNGLYEVGRRWVMMAANPAAYSISPIATIPGFRGNNTLLQTNKRIYHLESGARADIMP